VLEKSPERRSGDQRVRSRSRSPRSSAPQKSSAKRVNVHQVSRSPIPTVRRFV
jgi:hypothetical protein